MQKTPRTLTQEEEIHRLKRENDLLRQECDTLKKSAGHLLAQPALAFPFIAQHSQQYPIRLLCQAFDVSESGYYAWCHREPSAHQREDARLSAEIQQIFLDHAAVYGSPRIHAVLKARGVHCGRKRVVRLMQSLGLSAQPTRRRKPTSDNV
jgi:hypothetical protein